MRRMWCGSTRREFLGTWIPACAMSCLTGMALTGVAQADETPARDSQKHVFDEELARKVTYREIISTTYSSLIPFILRLDTALGRERVIELLKANSAEQAQAQGRAAAKRTGSNDLSDLRKLMTTGSAAHLWVIRIVESTDEVFEVRAAECLFAKVFQEGHADGELGFAAVCFGDYAFAESFNPKIELTRDKTIMQGHGVCNHRYVVHA